MGGREKAGTMANIDTERLKQSVDLRDLFGARVELRPETSGGREMSGPCLKCGGDDRLHVTADWFMCRQCHVKRGDAIEAVQWLGLAHDFRGACEYLSGGALTTTAGPVARRAPERKPTAPGWQAEPWQAAARAELHAAQTTLASPAGELGREYLVSRGLRRETWEAWGLGYKAEAWDSKLHAKRPAIVIPWQRERITALKYRFLTVPDGGLRYTSKAGGECLAFGLGLAGQHYGTLWLLEGELNALAAWQSLRFDGGRVRVNWDVLSFGSEGKAVSKLITDLARQYRQVIVWADKPEVAAAAMGAIPGAFGLRSPEPGGRKLDAAELGRLGILADFMTAAAAHFDADPAYLARIRAELEAAPC